VGCAVRSWKGNVVRRGGGHDCTCRHADMVAVTDIHSAERTGGGSAAQRPLGSEDAGGEDNGIPRKRTVKQNKNEEERGGRDGVRNECPNT
jgi:hypothetical protein